MGAVVIRFPVEFGKRGVVKVEVMACVVGGFVIVWGGSLGLSSEKEGRELETDFLNSEANFKSQPTYQSLFARCFR